jgi:hypothetical protein
MRRPCSQVASYNSQDELTRLCIKLQVRPGLLGLRCVWAAWAKSCAGSSALLLLGMVHSAPTVLRRHRTASGLLLSWTS